MRHVVVVVVSLLAFASSSAAQQCLHGEGETPEQLARRREALTAARLVNTMQANQPGASAGQFLDHASLFTAAAGRPIGINLAPNQDIVAGWRLRIDVTRSGYWFAIKDTTDPCAFAFVSNESGLILKAEPIR